MEPRAPTPMEQHDLAARRPGVHAPTVVLAIAKALKATDATTTGPAHRIMEQLVLLEEALGYVQEALAFVHPPHSEPVPPPVMAILVLQ